MIGCILADDKVQLRDFRVRESKAEQVGVWSVSAVEIGRKR